MYKALKTGNARTTQTRIINQAFNKEGGVLVPKFNSPVMRELCGKIREKYMDEGAQGTPNTNHLVSNQHIYNNITQ